ncbi:MAG TPA: tetratricopeptide repeat protein [Sulfurovum sp.]
MRVLLFYLFLSLFSFSFAAENDVIEAQKEIETLKEPMYKPLVERYMLDEVRSLRIEQQSLRAEMHEKVAQARLDVSDRAMNYMTSTVNNIFLILTAIASLVAILGWKSLRDAKEQTKIVVQQKLEEITKEYTEKLEKIEAEMQSRSEDIMTNQESIARSNAIHALWRRSNLEDNVQAKVEIYDQILEIDKNNVEALTYKADAVLELGQKEWALNLCNKALELDSGYAYSYWQRSCVNAEMGNIENAVSDIIKAIKISPVLANDIESESSFDGIRDKEGFKRFMNEQLPTLLRSE